jgi:hypothetical protein
LEVRAGQRSVGNWCGFLWRQKAGDSEVEPQKVIPKLFLLAKLLSYHYNEGSRPLPSFFSVFKISTELFSFLLHLAFYQHEAHLIAKFASTSYFTYTTSMTVGRPVHIAGLRCGGDLSGTGVCGGGEGLKARVWSVDK